MNLDAAYRHALVSEVKSEALGSVFRLTEDGAPTSDNLNILSLLPAEQLDELISEGRESRYATGEFLFQQGEQHNGIHFIRSGRVRSYYVSPSGREVTLAYWPKGHFVGAPQIWGGGEHMWSSVAVSPTVGLWLPGASLLKFIRQSPDLAVAVIQGLIQKSTYYTALAQIMATQSKSSRLGHLLLALAQPNTNGSNQATLQQQFSQEELASMVGSTRQSVSGCLNKFEKAAYIERDDNAIRIIDIAGLRAFCD